MSLAVGPDHREEASPHPKDVGEGGRPMSADSPHAEPDQALSVLEEIDAVCDRFEAEWQSYSRPEIRSYLAEVQEGARRRLLRELLRVDIFYRRTRGEEP